MRDLMSNGLITLVSALLTLPTPVGTTGTTGTQSVMTTMTGDWSPATAGVRGRLIATATEDSARRLQVRLELELENVNDVVLQLHDRARARRAQRRALFLRRGVS